MKKLIKTSLGIIGACSVVIPTSVLTSCSKSKTEVEKCNYTVKATVSADSNKISIAEGIKGRTGGKLFVNILSGGKCKIDDGENFSGENVYVPKWIDIADAKYTVTAILNYNCSFSQILDQLTLPDSVTSLDSLWGCNFTTIVIPSSVISIGQCAFESSSLNKIIFYGFDSRPSWDTQWVGGMPTSGTVVSINGYWTNYDAADYMHSLGMTGWSY